jgi:hypothetical protein
MREEQNVCGASGTGDELGGFGDKWRISAVNFEMLSIVVVRATGSQIIIMCASVLVPASSPVPRLNFFGDAVDADAALTVTRYQLGIPRSDALPHSGTGSSHDFGMKWIVVNDAKADEVCTALRIGRRGGNEQRKTGDD